MKIKRILPIFLLSSIPLCLGAQILDNEQANSAIKWKQINSNKFQLIFPEAFSPRALTFAKSLNIQLEQANVNMTRKAKKISIIIQENMLEQNGFVQLAPRKSELYGTPSGIADNQSWLTNLSLHEMRHVAQFDNLTGKLHKPFGEQLALALFALNLPSWYYEGDAVLHETLFSNGGRGRLASWQMPIRANIQSDIAYSFSKYIHGSFKDIVPSYYTIGYFMNSQLYEKNEYATGLMYENMRNKLIKPFNFQRALQKEYGKKAEGLFQETMQYLKQTWGTSTKFTPTEQLPLNDKFPTDYILPQKVDNKIYALQRGPQRVNRIIQIDPTNDNQRSEILKTGIQIMPYFDIKNEFITWDEYQRNPRFGKDTYSKINLYDLKNKRLTTIANKVRYYTPTLSPDLTTIACVEVDESNTSYLHLIDIASKKKIKSIRIEENIHIQQPQYHESGEKIIAIAVSEKGTSLIEIDTKTNHQTRLFPWTNIQFERPIYYQDAVVFKANNNNKDDIFMTKQGNIYPLTDVQFGAFNPSIQDSTLYFNNYTTKGLKIHSTPINIKDIDPIHLSNSKTLYSAQNSFKYNDGLASSDTVYAITPYNTLKHAINVHSISISGSEFQSFDNLKPGIFLLSNDVLNTTRAQLGYEYDTNLRKSTYSAEISYQKYLPKITIGYKNKGLIGSALTNNKTGETKNFDYRENTVTADLQIPLVQYHGNTISSYGLYIGTSYQHRYDVSLSNLKNFVYEVAFPLNYQLYFNRNSRRSRMDLFPRWGQGISLTFRHLPFDQKLQGTAWAVRTNFYFPGFALNHGIQVRYAMQANTGRFKGTNSIPLINGISYIPFGTIKNTLLIDYKLPIAYPDQALGEVFYLKRIYAGAHANYLNLQTTGIKPQAVGASLFFDFNVFKYNLPNFLFETKLNYLTTKVASKRFYPEFSLSYNY